MKNPDNGQILLKLWFAIQTLDQWFRLQEILAAQSFDQIAILLPVLIKHYLSLKLAFFFHLTKLALTFYFMDCCPLLKYNMYN